MNSDVIMVVIGVVAALSVIAVLTISSRYRQRDPRRAFTSRQRAHGFARAGHRCEHISMWVLRCPNTPTHGDHIHPWSRGGATTMGNFAALCATHNRAKSNTIPSRPSLWLLQRRRRSYFPPGEPVKVVWRIGAPAPPSRPTAHHDETTGRNSR